MAKQIDDTTALTEAQKQYAAKVVGDSETWGHGHELREARLRLATMADFEDAELHVDVKVAQNDPSIAWPIAVLESEAVENAAPGDDQVERVTRGLHAGLDQAARTCVSAESGRMDWPGDVDPPTSMRLDDALADVARALLTNAIRPTVHEYRTLIDGLGDVLANYERQ